MTDLGETPLHKLESGDELWLTREDVRSLALIAYQFTVIEYDSDYCRVEIHGHADAEADDE